MEFAYTKDGAKGLEITSETFRLKADQVFKAIGQTLAGVPDGITIAAGKLPRNPAPMLWCGGDCALGGEDLTVTAVAEGRDAAEEIHVALMGTAG